MIAAAMYSVLDIFVSGFMLGIAATLFVLILLVYFKK